MTFLYVLETKHNIHNVPCSRYANTNTRTYSTTISGILYVVTLLEPELTSKTLHNKVMIQVYYSRFIPCFTSPK